MRLFTIPVYESNACHTPAGSPAGGQFCSTGGGEPYEVNHYGRGGLDVRLPNGAYIMLSTPEIAEPAPKGYMFVAAILVPEKDYRRGQGRLLYRAALAAAKKRGYKGISSDPTMRSDVASAVWQSLARDGTVRKVGRFDVLES
jgi:hypothetical protein